MSQLRVQALSSYVRYDLHMQGIDFSVPSIGGPGFRTSDVAGSRLVSSLTKKLADDVSQDAEMRALKKFVGVNNQCLLWELSPCRSLVEDVILGEVRQLLWGFWFPGRNSPDSSSLCDNAYDLLRVGRMGPGASLGSSGDDFYSKLFAGPLTASNTLLYSLYSHYVKCYPRWLGAESLRHQLYGKALVVKHNRLSFVPKDNDICRTICTEPSLNMYFQLGLGNLLTRRLRSLWGVDLATQPKINRAFARRSSFDNSLATIDLSSASDSMSMSMLRWALPKQFFELLGNLRSESSMLPDGSLLPLNMVSTMGNGFTFPLQTILFTAVVRAVYYVMGIIPHSGELGNLGVFGDDIICTRESARMVIRTLELLGFNVNAEKSFCDGFFRESCGLDAYKGVDVRGVYLKEINETTPYVLFNRLNIWSTKTGIPLPTTQRYLLSCARFLPVPPCESDAAGFKVPLSLHTARRYDRNLSHVYFRVEPVSKNLIFSDQAIGVPKSERTRILNPDGAYLSFLGGYIENGRTAIRFAKGEKRRYRRRKAVSPFWGWTAVESAEAEIDPAQWQTACLLNFG